MNLGTLVVKLLLERAQFKTELAQTVQDVNAAATQVQGRTAAISGAVTDAVTGQATAVETATRALTVLGPVAATATAAALAVGLAYHQAHQETLGYEKAIILTGNAADVTAGQLGDMAKRIDGVVGTQANAAAALTAMTAGGKVARENLEKVSLAAIEMERAVGQSIGETEKIFSSLGKEPVKASLRLNESLNYLTASTYAQIKAAENLGETDRAASIAQNAAADVLRDRAAKVEKNLGTMERAWRGVRDLAKEAWDAMLNVGRPDSSADQLSKAGERVAYLQKQVDGRRSRGLATGDLDGQLAAAKALHDTLRETAKLDERAAGIKADLAAKDKARIELAQALEQSASKQEKMAIAIAQANALADRSGASAAERAQLVNAAREKYAEKESRAAKAALSDYDKLMQRLGVDVPKAAAEAEAAQHGYNKAQTEFLALAGSPAWAQFTNEQRAAVAVQFEKKIASEQAAEAIKAEEKATAEAVKAREKSLATAEKELEKLRASVVAQEEQNARLGLSKEAIAELDAAKLEMLATDTELQAIKALDRNLDEAQYEILKQQAQSYRDLAQAKRGGAARQVEIDREKEAEKEADKAAKEFERASDRIEQSLTDALMRGFESGKDFAKNLRDTVVNMFKTMVLRPVISAVLSPISGALGGAFGGGAAGGGGAGNLFNLASMGKNAYSLYQGGLSGLTAPGGMYYNFATSGLGQSLGLSNAAPIIGNNPSAYMPAGTQLTGAGSLSGIGAVGTAFGAVVGIAAALGAFAKTKQVGGGLQGTLGEGVISDYTLMRTGGSLFSGPDYDVLNKYRQLPELQRQRDAAGDTQAGWLIQVQIDDLLKNHAGSLEETIKTSDALQKTYADMRENTAKMADALGLSGDAIRNFTRAIGTEGLGDTGETGLQFNGLKPEEIQAKISEALATANNEMAEQLIGSWKTVTDTVTSTVRSGMWDTGINYDTQTSTSTRDVYVASEFARTGEKAIDTLTRLATSLGTVNDIWKNLGYTVYEASLAGADAASKMADAFGGLEAMAQATGTYFQNFYSAEEQRAAVERQLNEALGKLNLQLPDIDATDARAQYRALAEAQDRNTEAGREAYVVLLQLSGAFASVTEASETAADAAARLADEQGKAAEAAARAAEKAAEDAARAYEKTLAYLTKTAETAMQILGAAVDREKQSQQAGYQAQTAIIDAQRKAATTAMEAQRAWLGVAIGGAQNYAKAMESEAARIRGFFTGMVLQDDPDAPAGASTFAAQAALRAGDKSDAVLRKATDIDPEMFASWADYAVNFFETQGLVRGATQDAELAASMAYNNVAMLEQQLTLAEDKYKTDLEHYTKLEGIAKETLDSNLLRLDALVQSAQDQLAEATGTKLAVMTIAQAMGNFSGAAEKLAYFTGNAITTPLPTAPVLTPFGSQTADLSYAPPVVYNPVALGGSGTASSNDQVVAALRDVVAELQALRSTGADTKAAVEKTAALIDQVTAGGNAMLTETA